MLCAYVHARAFMPIFAGVSVLLFGPWHLQAVKEFLGDDDVRTLFAISVKTGEFHDSLHTTDVCLCCECEQQCVK